MWWWDAEKAAKTGKPVSDRSHAPAHCFALAAALGGAAMAALSQRLCCAPRADADIESHGLSAFGDLAYPADFQHFRYVDPNAPKGGTFSQIGPDRHYNQNFLTFNSLNSFILKGDAAQGMELTFATLMARCRRRARRHVRPRRRESAALGRRPHLSVLHPAGGQIPRRLAAHRP